MSSSYSPLESDANSGSQQTSFLEDPRRRRFLQISLLGVCAVALVSIAVILGVHHSQDNNNDTTPDSSKWAHSASDAEEKVYTPQYTSTRHDIASTALKTPNAQSPFAVGIRHTLYDENRKPVLYVHTDVLKDITFGSLTNRDGSISQYHIRTTYTQVETGISGSLIPMSDSFHPGQAGSNRAFFVEFGSYHNVVDYSSNGASVLMNNPQHRNAARFFSWALTTFIRAANETRNGRTPGTPKRDVGALVKDAMRTPDLEHNMMTQSATCWIGCGFKAAGAVGKCYKAVDAEGLDPFADYHCVDSAWGAGTSCACCHSSSYSFC